jgi:hypothetical protein
VGGTQLSREVLIGLRVMEAEATLARPTLQARSFMLKWKVCETYIGTPFGTRVIPQWKVDGIGFKSVVRLPLEPELAPCGWRCPHRRLTLMRPFGNW